MAECNEGQKSKDDSDLALSTALQETIVQGILRRTGVCSSVIETDQMQSASGTKMAETKMAETKMADTKMAATNMAANNMAADDQITNDVERAKSETDTQKYLLHEAFSRGEFNTVLDLLATKEHDVCTLDPEFKSPLHHALYACASYRFSKPDDSLWSSLIREEVLNQKDSLGNFPLDVAAGMKTRPLPVTMLHKLMTPQNISCYTLIKLAVIVGPDEFMPLLDYALPFFRPKDLKFSQWRAFEFDKHDQFFWNHCTEVTGSNRMLLRHCVDSERNIDQEKIRQLGTLLWNTGYTDLAALAEKTTHVLLTSARNPTLTSGVDVFGKTLAPFLSEPRSLLDCCRITVRNNMKDLSPESFSALQLPICLLPFMSLNKMV